MEKALLLITLLIVSSVSLSAPAYLDCSLSTDKRVTNFSVKLDESTGKITHTHDDGRAFNTDGFFSANTIRYQKISLSSIGIKTTVKYEINRTSLDFSRDYVLEATNPTLAATQPTVHSHHVGTCNIVNIKERKI